MSNNNYGMLIPVPLHVSERFTDEQIETAALVAFWTHPPLGFEVHEDPKIDWTIDVPRNRRIIRAIGKVVSCN